MSNLNVRPYTSKDATRLVSLPSRVAFYFSTGCKGAGLEEKLRVFYDLSCSLAEGGTMAEPSYEELRARVSELEKQKAGRRGGQLEFRVGEKGGVSVYGLGRFPVTLYYEQWTRLLDAVGDLRAFLEENKSSGKLKLKEEK
jgi:hypothetical protein